jgi:serine O-acetyltransferase
LAGPQNEFEMILLDYILSDVQRLYGPRFRDRIKIFVNPGFRAVLLLRLAQFSSGRTFWFWRNCLISFHGMDVGRGFSVGRGIRLPHPVGIVIGGGVKIGDNATIYQNVTLGKNRGSYPTLDNGVTVYPSAVVVGGIKVGTNSIIGALCYVGINVEPDAVVKKGWSA